MAEPRLWVPRPGLSPLCPLPTLLPQEWTQRVGSIPHQEAPGLDSRSLSAENLPV